MFPPDILLPGPTPIPAAIEQAMLTPMSDHRGAQFNAVHSAVREKLSTLFGVPNDGAVAVLPASGTGALESVIQNVFAPGDPVLAIVVGGFGERFAEIAEAMGLVVDRLEVPWGNAFSVESVLERIASRVYRGILVTHNETSTGVVNPVEALAAQLGPSSRRPLFIVDSISGVPSIPLTLADGTIDAIVAASQKGFMCPPGLGIVAVSARLRQSILTTRSGRFYLNLIPYFEGHLPYTPAVSLWYGLNCALDLLLAEGATARLARHQLMAHMTRAFGQAAGFPPMVEAAVASPTVTALAIPETTTPHALRQAVATLGLQVAGGMGPWSHSAFRVGHVGAVTPQSLFAGLATIAHFCSAPVAGLEAAWNVWHDAIRP